jgi:hypothetical protein
LIAVLSWTWTVLRRDPVPAPPSPEALARMQKLASDDEVVPKERIFAAVGVKITRSGQNEDPIESSEEEHSPELSA